MLAKNNVPMFFIYFTNIKPMDNAPKKNGRKNTRYDKTNCVTIEKSKNNLYESNLNNSDPETLTDNAINKPERNINTGSKESIFFNSGILNKEMKVPAAPKPNSATEMIIYAK
jgi:hypothetical protein